MTMVPNKNPMAAEQQNPRTRAQFFEQVIQPRGPLHLSNSVFSSSCFNFPVKSPFILKSFVLLLANCCFSFFSLLISVLAILMSIRWKGLIEDTGRLNYLKDSASKTETETGWVFHPWVCRYQNGQEVKNPPRETRQSSQNSHQEPAKIARWRNFARIINQKLFGIKFCVENWYHTLHSNHAVQSSTDLKSGVFDDLGDFWNALALDCVIQLKHMKPIFHTKC